jgi:hypothetical protein
MDTRLGKPAPQNGVGLLGSAPPWQVGSAESRPRLLWGASLCQLTQRGHKWPRLRLAKVGLALPSNPP